MKAQVIRQFGSPEVFEALEVAKPRITLGHVLIKVAATSVNPIDCKIRSGAVGKLAPQFPAILHGDVAGTVEEVGSDISVFKVGDQVYGFAGGISNTDGALAQYMLADQRFIAKKPSNISMLEAAALPLVSITAWLALFNKANLTRDQSVLIHGGMGGVGHIAIQLAKSVHSKVYTTVGKASEFAIVKSLGADEAINYRSECVAEYRQRLTKDNGFDLIFDTVGGENLRNSFLAVSYNGVIVTTQSRLTLDLSLLHEKGLSLHLVFALLPFLGSKVSISYAEILSKISILVEEGKLTPMIDPHHFTLDTVNEAHAYLESGKADGKIVINIDCNHKSI